MAVTLGRTVHFLLGRRHNGAPVYRAADVVEVNNEETGSVNLVVKLDGMNDFALLDENGAKVVTHEEAIRCTAWRTSVVQGEEPGTWRWPPRAN